MSGNGAPPGLARVGLRPVEATLWRRGCHPQREIDLALDAFDEDFDFDSAGVAPDEAVRIRAEADPRGAATAWRLRLGFRAREGRRHWIVADRTETAWSLREIDGFVKDDGDRSLGTEGGEAGVFFPDIGDPVAFGAPGQPRLDDILSGHHLPTGAAAPVSPDGVYQVEGDAPDLVTRNPMHDGGAPGLPADRPGLAACVPRDAHVITSDGMTAAEHLAQDTTLRTVGHGWQRVLWVSKPPEDRLQQPVYLGLERGIPDSPDSAAGRILILTGRISRPGLWAGDRP